ncbi:MAG: esterase family protein, partial [Lentisphaerae bacterium]|nr:esterase family protein [Lentisphaerota bacterium]
MKTHSSVALLACLLASAAVAQDREEGVPVSGLRAVCRQGQVFVTWSEAALPSGSTLNVYSHTAELGPENLAEARPLARQVDPCSARDWWQDPASFSADAAPGEPVGWRLGPAEMPLDPSGGLFVHTVTAETAGPRWYAVTWTDASGREHGEVLAGVNATTAAVEGAEAQVRPFWQGAEGALPGPDSASGRRLVLVLHGRGGGVTAGERASAVNCLWFGDATQGWREGLPFKFHLSLQPDSVVITPMDRVWVGRPVLESKDRRDHCPAVSTWWFGYNAEIRRTTQTGAIVAPNYTERLLLALVRWAQRDLGCDPGATYVRGGSMGGSGAVALALHFPEVFAAVLAQVPVYAMTRPGSGSAVRLECVCGPLGADPAVTADGVPLLQYFDGPRNIQAASADTPPIFATNGRRDASIPWENNPPFYAAANRARQAFAVYWNNGGHGMSGEAPADVKAWSDAIYRYRLDTSYLAFSECSDDRRYGHGDPADGDLEGWINRGLGWSGLEDSAEVYAVTVTADYPGVTYPVSVAVTPRRRQSFRPPPG